MIVVIAGTGTEVGKTWFAAQTIAVLRADGFSVSARKIAQSFDPADPAPTDAEVLGSATGEPPEVVCPRDRWYEVAMAPPMAAAALGRPSFTIIDLAAEIVPSTADVTVIETAGGVRSPLADDGDSVDLCSALQPDLVVIVADAGLGTINSVRLAAGALDGNPLVIALNYYDPGRTLHRANAAWLRDRDGLDIVTDPTALAERVNRSRPIRFSR